MLWSKRRGATVEPSRFFAIYTIFCGKRIYVLLAPILDHETGS
jgi:hypothetical protein